MAVSKNFSTSNKYIVYWIEMIQNSQSIANNTSNVTVRVWVKRTNTGYTTYGSGTVYCTINGTRYSASITSSQTITSSPRVLFTKTLNISHNSNGTKVLGISASISHARFSSGTNSANFTLTTIPRYVKITSYSISDIRGTQLKVNFGTDKAINAQQYRLNSGTWHTLPSNGIITGLSPGTRYNVQIRVRSAQSNLWTDSANRAITTVRLSTYTIPDFDIGNNISVTISRGHSNIYHDITLQLWSDELYGWIDLTTKTNISTSTTFVLTESQINQSYNTRKNSRRVTYRIKVINRWGLNGTVQGINDSGNFFGNIVNAEPTIDSVTYFDTAVAVQNILNDDQKILRNKSELRVKAGTATAKKGATLKSYKVTIGGNEYTVNAGTNVTEETGKLINVGYVNQSANQTAILTVTDSRGYTASKSFTVQILDYVEPQFLQAVAERVNNYEKSSFLKIEGRRSIVKPADIDVNETYLRYRIKENPSGTYGSYIDVISENTSIQGIYQNFNTNQYMNDFPNNLSYTVEVGIKDKFSDWKTILITLPEGIALLRFLQDQIQAGVPLVDQSSGQPYIFFAESEEW